VKLLQYTNNHDAAVYIHKEQGRRFFSWYVLWLCWYAHVHYVMLATYTPHMLKCSWI